MEEIEKSIKNFLLSSDPLSSQAFEYLLTFKEEDSFVDFKVSFNPDDEREWLEISKDVMAFANTQGGYLVFGVENGTFKAVGLDENIAYLLADTDKLQQKINRFVEPDIVSVRSKYFQKQGKHFTVIFIPESIDLTHMVSKDGVHKFPSGEKKAFLKKGTFYLRRSGGNHLGDPRDFEEVVKKRLDLFKESILGKIARVVEAPQHSEIFVVSQDSKSGGEYKFRIDNAPDSMPVKGMSFSVSPQTPEQEIAGWIAMWQKDSAAVPPPKILWRWYAERRLISLTEEQRAQIAQFSMISGVPFFFWLQNINGTIILKMLKNISSQQIPSECIPYFLGVAASMGKTVHKNMVDRLGKQKVISSHSKRYPIDSFKEKFHQQIVESQRPRGSQKISESQFRKQIEKNLDAIAESVQVGNKDYPSVMDRRDAIAFDCYLYANG